MGKGFYKTGKLDWNQAKSALEQLLKDSSEDREYELRICAWHAYNDKFHRYFDTQDTDGLPVPTQEDRDIFEENCRCLRYNRRTSDLMCAELCREIGEFDECLGILDSLENRILQIREHAMAADRDVFEFKGENWLAEI